MNTVSARTSTQRVAGSTAEPPAGTLTSISTASAGVPRQDTSCTRRAPPEEPGPGFANPLAGTGTEAPPGGAAGFCSSCLTSGGGRATVAGMGLVTRGKTGSSGVSSGTSSTRFFLSTRMRILATCSPLYFILGSLYLGSSTVLCLCWIHPMASSMIKFFSWRWPLLAVAQTSSLSTQSKTLHGSPLRSMSTRGSPREMGHRRAACPASSTLSP
mmetsp:Transcript_36543/g.103206  ORF Transcript_36543/g.103206 Transcript_36543/m.103206 type:complete len:214 (+) Transcript_36543:410-1051(+)